MYAKLNTSSTLEFDQTELYPPPLSQCWLPGKLSDKDLQHYIWAARSITALAGICNGGNLEKGNSSFNELLSTICSKNNVMINRKICSDCMSIFLKL